MAKTRSLRFKLHISAHEYQSYYQGAARSIFTTAHNGLTVKFPANILRPFVQHDGIHGEFVLDVDENNKFVAIRRVGG